MEQWRKHEGTEGFDSFLQVDKGKDMSSSGDTEVDELCTINV